MKQETVRALTQMEISDEEETGDVQQPVPPLHDRIDPAFGEPTPGVVPINTPALGTPAPGESASSGPPTGGPAYKPIEKPLPEVSVSKEQVRKLKHGHEAFYRQHSKVVKSLIVKHHLKSKIRFKALRSDSNFVDRWVTRIAIVQKKDIKDLTALPDVRSEVFMHLQVTPEMDV